MGCFSELDIIKHKEIEDKSSPSFDEQLTWRYEALRERYLDARNTDAPVLGDDRFSSDDYRYAPLECFKTTSDIWRALEIAREDLESKCGIVPQEDGTLSKVEDEEEDPSQITIFEFVLWPSWFQTAVAA